MHAQAISKWYTILADDDDTTYHGNHTLAHDFPGYSMHLSLVCYPLPPACWYVGVGSCRKRTRHTTPSWSFYVVFSSKMMSEGVSWHLSLKEAILLHLTSLSERLHHGNQRHGQLSTTPHISARGLLQMV